HNNPDGYNINLNCGSTHLSSLQEFVRNNDVDLGFAFDGDADRVLSVDRNGQVVDGDIYLYIMAQYLKKQNKLVDNTLVTTVMSNIGLYKALDQNEIEYVKTAVGDKYVFESMNENGYILGGEQSGHIIFKEYGNTGDGILSALKLLEALASNPSKSLSELASEVHIYPQILVNVKVQESSSILDSPLLEKMINDVEDKLAGDGRVLIRASGTEPLIRVMIEASSDELCNEYANLIVDVIKSLI
ncbi:MAG: phosphoglucosamine mutase, partial [Bacilli bacterium]